MSPEDLDPLILFSSHLSGDLVIFSCLFLGAWVAVTAIANSPFPGLVRWVRARDPLCLVPSYGFFAPIPVTEDFTLLARAVPSGSWAVLYGPERRRLVHAVWNPERRCFKVLADAMLVTYRTGDLGVLEREVFVALARSWCRQCAPEVQFAFAVRDRYGDLRVFYVSDVLSVGV